MSISRASELTPRMYYKEAENEMFLKTNAREKTLKGTYLVDMHKH